MQWLSPEEVTGPKSKLSNRLNPRNDTAAPWIHANRWTIAGDVAHALHLFGYGNESLVAEHSGPTVFAYQG